MSDTRKQEFVPNAQRCFSWRVSKTHCHDYLSIAARAIPTFAFIDLTEASGSFLDARRSKESSSSKAL